MTHNVFDQLKEGLLIVNKRYEIQFCNDSILRHLKYNMKELQGIRVDKIVLLPDDKNTKSIELCGQKKWRLISSEGKILHIQGKVIEEEWNGEKAYWLIVHEYKPYSVETLEHILENMPYGVWLRDTDGNIQYINQNGIECYNKLYDSQNKIGNCNKSINWKRKKRFDVLQVPLLDEKDQVKEVIGIIKYAVRQSDADRVLRKDLYIKQKEKKNYWVEKRRVN